MVVPVISPLDHHTCPRRAGGDTKSAPYTLRVVYIHPAVVFKVHAENTPCDAAAALLGAQAALPVVGNDFRSGEEHLPGMQIYSGRSTDPIFTVADDEGPLSGTHAEIDDMD